MIHHLQHALPDAERFLDLRGPTVTWRADAPYILDVTEFEDAVRNTQNPTAIMRAVELYSGELLPACYDEWIVPERVRLRQHYTELLERGIAVLECAHEYATAIRYAQRLIEHEPLHEQAYSHLMRLHVLSGDWAAALRTYETCATVLEEELGVEPSTATRVVYEHVLQERFIVQSAAKDRPKASFPPTNLPAPLTPFIGRERVVAAVVDRLRRADVRLLTLTGAGGIGKTRLALHVGASLRHAFRDGVFWVDLSSLRDPAFVLSAIAHSLGVAETGDQPLAAQLMYHLRDKRMLLVLDNFEQVILAGPIVTDLLQTSPHLTVLITNREALHIYSEHLFEVPPLMLPDPDHGSPYDSLVHNEAIYLFIYHAQAANPLFVFTPQQAPLIVDLCARLDGLPLAIELAAARSKLLSLETMVDQILTLT